METTERAVQAVVNTTAMLPSNLKIAANLTNQISNAFFTAALHGQNLLQTVESIVKSLAVRSITAALTSLIPGVSFAGAFMGGFQHGGSFTVPGIGGPDSQFVGLRATPGERVTITPPGVTNNNQQATIQIYAPELTSLEDDFILETRIMPKIVASLRDRGVAV
jgi:hypothetical protein